MLKDYFKLLFRSLLKNKLFSFVNISGLAIGMAASLLLFLYIGNELSYDQFLENKERLYRLRCDNLTGGTYSERMAVTNGPVAKAAKSSFPEIEDYVQLNNFYLDGSLSTDVFQFKVKNSFFASDAFFKVFSYKLVKGNANNVLNEVNSIVLSESMAKKFFGNKDPMGKEIMYNKRHPLVVTGVFADVPSNTHLKFDVLVSYKTLTTYYDKTIDTEEAWNSDESNYTYFKLRSGTDPFELEGKLASLVKKKIGGELKANNQQKIFSLMPVTDIHLNSHFDNEIEENGSKETVWFLFIIALIILVIAWVNFINLATAGSFRRFKEIGVRMVSGATKSDLRVQFILEALFVNGLAFIIAGVVVKLVYPYFSAYTGMEISSEAISNKSVWIIFVVLVLLGAFLSSLYPAFIISSVNPSQVLKGKNNRKVGNISFRKILIGTQFAISVSLIIGTIIIVKQVDFLKSQKLGASIDQTLVVQRSSVLDSLWPVKHERFKNELKGLPHVKDVCYSRHTPGEPINFTQGFKTKIGDQGNSSHLMYNNFVDADFFKLYGVKLLAGKDFIKGNQDIQVIINQRSLQALGFKSPEEALGKSIFNEGWNYTHTIVGIVENFHQQSPKEEYYPMVFMHMDNPYLAFKYSIKLQTKDMKSDIADIEKRWADIFPGENLEYYFLDEKYNNQYKSDIQFGRVFLLFAIIAICIACVGLFALTLYTILLRTKELAVRKVIGASVKELFLILSKDYFKLAIYSSLVAIPAMYFVMTKWLENYAIKTSMSIWFYILPVFILLVVILLSVSFLIIKSAKANLIKNLRSE